MVGDSTFEKTHHEWLEDHRKRRSGDRLRRLNEGHNYLEKSLVKEIWWGAFESLDGTHPEYEVQDFHDGKRYLDLAYRPESVRIALEADGYGPHVKDITVEKHADLLLRDAFLIADGWTVLHVSTHIIKKHPREMQLLLKQIVQNQTPIKALSLTAKERAAIRYARRANRPITPKELANELSVTPRNASEVMRKLESKGIFRVVSGTLRARKFGLVRPKDWLWV